MSIARPHILHRRDRVVAVMVSLFMHALVGVGALMLHLQDRTAPQRAVLLELQQSPPQLPAEATRDATDISPDPAAGVRTPAAVRSAAPATAERRVQSDEARAEASDVLRDERPLVPVPADAVCIDSLPPVIATTSAMERISQEEAFGELMRLLERHPEFKETILREMLAGDGAVAAPAKLEIFGLDELLALHRGKLALPGAGSRALGGVNPNPTYSPIHGTNPNPVAGSFNYIGLLLKLISLIRGE